MKAQMKVAKNLERVNPGFHLPGFVSKQSGAAAGDRKEFPGTIGPRELDRPGRIFRQKLGREIRREILRELRLQLGNVPPDAAKKESCGPCVRHNQDTRLNLQSRGALTKVGANSSTSQLREGTTLLPSSRRTFLQSVSKSAAVLSLEGVLARSRPLHALFPLATSLPNLERAWD